MHFLSSIGSYIITPLYYAISVVLVGFHRVFGQVFGQSSGVSWALSIIGLTVMIRAALIPLFVKQIKSSRNMQMLQPKVKELQKKYGHDRERLAAETMALYKESGTNPFASCMPILLQMPIFLALFRLLNHAAHNQAKGILTAAEVRQLSNATLFHAKIAASFTHPISMDHALSVRILAAVLVVAMTATTFLTQRQLMSKNMPADAMTGQYAQQQKMLLYVLPLVFAFGGIAFPIGVLFYWTTSNMWTMGQQFYVIRNNPAPGTPAFEAKRKRDEAKGRKHPVAEVDAAPAAEGGGGASPAKATGSGAVDRRPAQRQQPRRQTREQRKKQVPRSIEGQTNGANGGDSPTASSPGEESA